MKKDTHPEYTDSKIICGCGAVTETKATVSQMKVDICSACHPFYTGTQKLVDTAGRVEKFRNRQAKAKTAK